MVVLRFTRLLDGVHYYYCIEIVLIKLVECHHVLLTLNGAVEKQKTPRPISHRSPASGSNEVGRRPPVFLWAEFLREPNGVSVGLLGLACAYTSACRPPARRASNGAEKSIVGGRSIPAAPGFRIVAPRQHRRYHVCTVRFGRVHVISPSSIFRTRPPVDPATGHKHIYAWILYYRWFFLRAHTHTRARAFLAVRTITAVYVVGVTNTGSRLECTPIHRPRLTQRIRSCVCVYKPLWSAWPMMTGVFHIIICLFSFESSTFRVPNATGRPNRHTPEFR